VIEVLRLYDVTFLYLLLQFIAIPLLGRSSGSGRRQARPASDATWFLGVYFWGFESAHNLMNLWGGITLTGGPGILTAVIQWLIYDYIIPGLVVFLVVLPASFAAEFWARQRGLPARPSDAGLPPGVVAALLGVQFGWIGCLARAVNQ
jgi:hypothetical protein